jgi:transcriptional regulator of met regulon
MKHKIRKIFVSIDLEMLYDQIKTTPEHVKEIKEGITSVLLTNFSKHMINASTMFADTKLIEQRNSNITSKQLEYVKRTGEVEKMLNDIIENEKKLLSKKAEVDEKLSLKPATGLNRDVEYLKLVRPIELKLDEINDKKKDLMRNLVGLKIKHDNLLLVADSFSFDILVMLQTVNQKLLNDMEI